MRCLTLHIGRHKTGTTAIQNFLFRNREQLLERGFYVPMAGRDGAGHHRLSRELSTVKKRRLKRRGGAGEAFLELAREVGQLEPGPQLLISSEDFQNCDPAVVSKALAAYRTRVVVYIREQVNYLASAYAQRVHATDYSESMERYYRKWYSANYQRFLRAWQRRFPEQFKVRRYGRNHLHEGDIVRDYCRHALGLTETEGLATATDGKANRSLNARVLQFKLRLNREGGPGEGSREALYYALPELNDQFPAPPVGLSRGLHNRVIWDYHDSNRAVAKRYFGERDLFDFGACPPLEMPALSDAEYSAMRRALEREMRQYLERRPARIKVNTETE